MPGQDFYSFEDARKVSKQAVREQKRKENPIPVVVEVRGYRSTVRRELERRVAKEITVAKKLKLKQIGITWLPVRWPVERPIFLAPSGMARKDFCVKSVEEVVTLRNKKRIKAPVSYLVRRWTGEFTLASF